MILDGRRIAQEIRKDISERAARLKGLLGRPPHLAVVLVGEDGPSRVYVRNKERAAAACGIDSETLRLQGDIAEKDVLDLVSALDRDDTVDGVLVQLPLPGHIQKGRVIDRIHPDKDVDGFHAMNVGAVAIGHPRMAPCTAKACLELIERSGIGIEGAEVVVVGASMIAGMPTALMLTHAGATVTVTHVLTRDLASHVRRAEVLVSATGVPELIKGEWIREGAVVIDVGICRVGDRLVGDVEFEPAAQRAAAITPVPGGVGPMTITMLLLNTLHAAERRAEKLGLMPSSGGDFAP